MQTLDVGEIATINTKWYNASLAAAEPSAITLTVHPPIGVDIVKTKADMGVGASSDGNAPTLDVWSYSQLVTLAGLWRYDVEGVVDGNAVVLPSGTFLVGVEDRTGPCEPWCTWEEVSACNDGADAASSGQREYAIDLASEILFNVTGRRYTGVCQTTRSLCYACFTCRPFVCTCEPANAVDLGRLPVWGAWDVVVGGVTLDPTAYTIIDRRWLTRLDGDVWPSGGDVTDPDAFRLTLASGHLVPLGGRRAAALFASEIALGCLDDDACQLPQRVNTIVREGTTYVVLDSLKMIEDARTGIPMTDLWVAADAKGRHGKSGAFMPGATPEKPRRIRT